LNAESHIATTELCRHLDTKALEPGSYHYVMVLDNGVRRSEPVRCTLEVKSMPAPGKVSSLRATPELGQVRLAWTPLELPGTRYHILKAEPGSDSFTQVTSEPVLRTTFIDRPAQSTTADDSSQPSANRYVVLAVNRQGKSGPKSDLAEAAPKPISRDPIFDATGTLPDGGKLAGSAKYKEGTFDLTQGGHATFPQKDLYTPGAGPGLSVECRIRFTGETVMPIPISDGQWNASGWFLQQISGRWRWHVGGVDCDGGKAPKIGEWTHMLATYDGSHARLYQDGNLVANVPCRPATPPWKGQLFVGQYSGGPGNQYQVLGEVADIKLYPYAVDPAPVK